MLVARLGRITQRALDVAFGAGVAGVVGLTALAAYEDWAEGPPPVHPALAQQPREGVRRQRVVVVGSGWAAVAALKGLKPGRYDVTCISEHNYFLFTPLLPSVTVGTLHAASLVEPMRNICRGVEAEFLQARVVDVDPQQKTVTITRSSPATRDERADQKLPYDVLLFAVGARSVTWGVVGVEENCCFLKSISDARRARTQIINLFEEASLPHYTDDDRRRLLHFVVVGGGPTGVEFAAELCDFIQEDLSRAFPRLAKEVARISLIQSADHILNTYDAAISHYAERRFKLNNINVILHARVDRIEPHKIFYFDKQAQQQKMLEFGLCMWSTGVGPQEVTERLVDKLGEAQKNKRAIVTDNRLRVLGAEDIFALGDCATIAHPHLVESTIKWFEHADVNGDGKLSFDEFSELAKTLVRQHPQLRVHMQSLSKMFKQFDVNGDGFMSPEELGQLMAEVDNKLKSLPATAQVASQQGHYVARLLNHAYLARPAGETLAPGQRSYFHRVVDEFRAFRYHHVGSLAYVGSDRAVIDFGSPGWWAGGIGAFFLWRSAYFSEQVSTSTRVALAIEWAQRPFLGRNIAKY